MGNSFIVYVRDKDGGFLSMYTIINWLEMQVNSLIVVDSVNVEKIDMNKLP